MKIVVISDTHGYFPKLPEGDMLIHCGDLTMGGTLYELNNFRTWWEQQDFKYKICIAGNHDFCLENEIDQDSLRMQSGVTYFLHDMLTEIEGLRIYGSPWTPRFMNWAFMKDRGIAIADKWAKIPNNLDLLITHGPPMGILDYSIYSHNHVGCADLLAKVIEVQPKYHLFGHIHGSYGIYKDFNTTFINASQLDERYQLFNKPIVIEL